MFHSAVLPFLVTALAAQEPAFEDPAPPVVHELEPLAAPPEPEAFPELHFHAAPRAPAPDASTEDWPCFLGPRHDGTSHETRLAKSFAETGPPLVWEVERGEGFASPVVQGKRLIHVHRVGGATHVDCLDTETGRRSWRFSYPTEYRGRYISDGGPRATPVVSGERVFVHGVKGLLHCLDLASGRVVWMRDLAADFGLSDGFFGVVSSLLVHEGLLIVTLGAPGGPTVAAFDERSGKLVWGAGTRWGADCASPIVASVRGAPRLFVVAGGESRPPTGGLMVLDPIKGTLEFEYPFRSKTYESVLGASPVVAGESVFLTAAYNTGSAMLRLKEGGGFEELWTDRHIGIEFTTPLYVENHLYLVDGVHDGAGAIVCLDPKTGKELARTDLDWSETVVDQGKPKELSMSIGAGSMIHADGRFLCLGENGHLLWLDCTPAGAKVLARASLFHANQSWTPPVVSRGLLYVLQTKHERFGDRPARLLCYDLREGE
jgi:outer membrane protein assembly factor BamB